jgi:hypothetical protein
VQAHEESERFNPGWLEDENEKILLELLGSCITPLCSQAGRVALTASRIYFQPFNVASNSPIQTYHLSKVSSAHPFQLPQSKISQCSWTFYILFIERLDSPTDVHCSVFQPECTSLQAQSLMKRTYLLQNIGLEIFFSGRNSLYLTFKSTRDRDRLAGASTLLGG